MVWIRKKSRFGHSWRKNVLALFLCAAMLTGCVPIPVSATDMQERRFQDIVNFISITLHENADGRPGDPIRENALIGRDSQMILWYTYEIAHEKIREIEAGIRYELEITRHLVLPELQDGRALTIDTGQEEAQVEFARLYADGKKAWIEFAAGSDGMQTVLSEYEELTGAYFYLDCGRALAPPEGEPPLEQECNRYAMKFENGQELVFGYAENEPVWSKAKLEKNGSVQNKTITWTVAYTPWQNPKAEDGLSTDTPFELRDTIDFTKHRFVQDSAKADGMPLTVYTNRADLQQQEEAYVLVEMSEDGNQLLSFGGTKFAAGEATGQNPAKPLQITYETEIVDALLLPGDSSASKIQNQAVLYAQKEDGFHALDIKAGKIITVPKPKWVEKSGKTTRHQDGTGSETDWTVTFFPNGFSFENENDLTLCDSLPAGSTLVEESVKVNQAQAAVRTDVQEQEFRISGIMTSPEQPVTITYKTVVPEEMYDSGTGLGDNRAWFTFRYNEQDYRTPEVKTPVDSGGGSQSSGTATLVKSSHGYQASDRSIAWTAVVNPHRSNFKKGTFVDDLKSAGKDCGILGHTGGMELKGGTDAVVVRIDGREPENDELVKLKYEDDKLIVAVGNIGRRTITLDYTTKISDPCVFAANTEKVTFTNTIVSEDMIIGDSEKERSAQASAKTDVSATVLKKKEPVYHYADGSMVWTVEVNASGLEMEDVELTDFLPEGLHYRTDSVTIAPIVSPAAVEVSEDRNLKIVLGKVNGKTTVTFVTDADPEIFNNDSAQVKITNTIAMTGSADGVEFQEVSHTVSKSFTNHGLVKNSKPEPDKELISYEVLINPYGLKLEKDATLIDTLDKRLQPDMDTLRLYQAQVSGTSADAAQKPVYRKTGEGQMLKADAYDPENNSFRVRLPVEEHDTGAYVLTYTADIIRMEKGSYGNSIRFQGSSVLLGGSKNNSASIAGGGGGGGGGVAARKARITVTKKDSETKQPLEGAVFTLYYWNSEKQERELAAAQAVTDKTGTAVFQVKPHTDYELEETRGIPGYDSTTEWTELPAEAVLADNGMIRITSGAAASKIRLEMTNKMEADKEPGDGTDGEGEDTDDNGNNSGSGDTDGEGDNSGSGGTEDNGNNSGSGDTDGEGDNSGSGGTEGNDDNSGSGGTEDNGNNSGSGGTENNGNNSASGSAEGNGDDSTLGGTQPGGLEDDVGSSKPGDAKDDYAGPGSGVADSNHTDGDDGDNAGADGSGELTSETEDSGSGRDSDPGDDPGADNGSMEGDRKDALNTDNDRTQVDSGSGTGSGDSGSPGGTTDSGDNNGRDSDDSDSEGLTGDRTGGDMGDYLGTENDGTNQSDIAGNRKNDEKERYADSDIPKTGNAIPLLLWSFLLTGAVLIVMTCYRFRMAVKHENQ